jgi:transcriptional regulator with XRE-family HTH domain
MGKLKDLRINANMSQSQVADVIKTFPNVISNYENGIQLPQLEDAAILENYFGQSIDWSVNISPAQKFDTVQNIIELYQRYPVPMVSEFLARIYRKNQSPERYIAHYANRIICSEEPML